MKRTLLMCVCLSLMFLFGLDSVNAATSINSYQLPYSTTVPKRKDAYLPWQKASYNYGFSLNKVTNSAGKAAIHSYLQTNYGGDSYSIGNKLTLSGAGYTGAVLWKPSKKTSPSGYSFNSSSKCSGPNTTEYYCIIKDSQYRLKLSNENWLNEFKISGYFIFTD